MKVNLEASWKQALSEEFDKDYFVQLTNFVKQQYKTKKVFPEPKNIFRALDSCPFEKVKVIILGQDPYHGDVSGKPQAQGLSFSVPSDFPLPPSLQNIFKELSADIGCEIRKSGDLSDWSRQGVLLLNATLTVEARKAGSHQGRGWEQFTDEVISTLSDNKDHVVFILWGSYARSKKPLIDDSKHLIVESPHPSPLSAHRGFFGSRPFSKTNQYLSDHKIEKINWC